MPTGPSVTSARTTRSGIRKWVILTVTAVVLFGVAAMVVRERTTVDGGADSAEAGARAVLDALTASNRDQLLDLADPRVAGRAEGVDGLITSCGGVAFGPGVIGIRGGYGPDVAWADIRQPGAEPPCNDLVLTFSRLHGRWFVALGKGESGLPTSSTDR